MGIGTIDLDIEMDFAEALKFLLDGKCIGIKPKGNANFLVKYKPSWMNQESDRFLLCWNRGLEDDGNSKSNISTESYLDKWKPVVINHNQLPKVITDLFLLRNITAEIKKFEETYKSE